MTGGGVCEKGHVALDWRGHFSQECPNGACVFRGRWTMTALAKSASSRLNSLSLSSRKGNDVVKMKGAQFLWARATKSWTSVILQTISKNLLITSRLILYFTFFFSFPIWYTFIFYVFICFWLMWVYVQLYASMHWCRWGVWRRWLTSLVLPSWLIWYC